MNSDELRRAREYAAWILLAAAAVQVFIGAWTLSGLPGGPGAGAVFHSGSLFGRAIVAPLWARAEYAVPYLVEFTVTALPVAAVLLAALGGRPVGTANRVTLTAVIIQAVALALGLVAWVAVLGKTGRWLPVFWAVDIAVAVAGLILTNAVLRSLRAEPGTRPGVGARKR
jgi:hypothetical protein